MTGSATILSGNTGGAGSLLPAAGARYDSGVDLTSAQRKAAKRRERYGHRPAVVLLGSVNARNSLEQTLFTRGAAVANLRTPPPLAQIEDLLASGLILLAPPNHRLRAYPAEWVEVPEKASTQESVEAALTELERRGVLLSHGDLLPGEGI